MSVEDRPGTAQPLRVAVIGYGERGRDLATWIGSASTPAQLVSIVDPSEECRSVARTTFGGSVELEIGLAGIRAPQIDAAIVATPDDTHAAVAIELLGRGIPVYLEKPMATTVEDADAILDAAARTGTRIYVGHNMRHTAMAQTMKSLVQSGEIGEVTGIWCRHFVGHGGDYYFKDWHADRTRSTGLLLQKAAHDIDFMHWLADSYSTRVVGMGDLLVYGRIHDRRDRSGERMKEWFSLDNWPPLEQTGLNPVVDVEDVSMVLMRFASGAMGSYQQCHFTPDYWRNFTVIGTEGRLENFGDSGDGVIRAWKRRSAYSPSGDAEYEFRGDDFGHDSADRECVEEFLRFVADGTSPVTSVLGGRFAVAAGVAATRSLRADSEPQTITPVDDEVTRYFELGQPAR
ncbi:Gfo/Idh/MocA family protein [Herbiconiux daphne]|uniref:Gfo/Idh/MocA family oxidoreductase n=1 Tax=Herbiconiux daphne TaxID=2970914 RepID=A0ABT2GW51_9MICO|nr:Gfo/Idh/MocA family oxidoreductase [Herbiconiux daphne]MCS5732187.1 Gfo/Idh/MocA family oxidoreductase [Herbiconiux daphne]